MLRQLLTTLLFIIVLSGFDADTRKVDAKLLEAKPIMKEAKQLFADLELEKSKAKAEAVLGIIKDAYLLALEGKDLALYWIFVTEWLVVSGTGLLTGFVVWTLMIRKRLYREVHLTQG